MKQLWTNTYPFNTDLAFSLYTLLWNRCWKFPLYFLICRPSEHVALTYHWKHLVSLPEAFSNFSSLPYPKLDGMCEEMHFPESSLQPKTDENSSVNTPGTVPSGRKYLSDMYLEPTSESFSTRISSQSHPQWWLEFWFIFYCFESRALNSQWS